MCNIKISVIITVYNMEKYIGECIESVLAQNIENIEIICVDDASVDRSFELLKEYKKVDDRINIICNRINQGQASARNKGCRLARGEYLYIMDGDDCLKQGALRKLYDCAKVEQLDIITFEAESFTDEPDMQLVCEQTKELYRRKYKYEDVLQGAELFSEFVDKNDVYGSLCLQFVDRNFFHDNQLYGIEGLRYCEDDPFEMYLKAKRVRCISDILYRRRIRKGSVTTSQHEVCHLESIVIQYIYNMQVWQSCSLTKKQNLRIEKYFQRYHLYIKTFEKKIGSINEGMLLEKYPMVKYIYNYYIRGEPIICKNLTSDVIEELLHYENVIIYGAGVVAQEAVKILEENNICNYLIAVSKKKSHNEQFERKMVYSIEELENICHDSIVLVATTSKYYKEIEEKLGTLDFKNIIYVD